MAGIELLVTSAEMKECLAVATDDSCPGAFSESDLPRIVFTKAAPRFARPALQFSALCRMLKSDVLQDVTPNELQPLGGIAAAFEKFRRRNAAHKNRPLRQFPIPAEPRHRRARNTGLHLVFQIDQERRIKQRGSHGGPYGRDSWPALLQPNRQARA